MAHQAFRVWTFIGIVISPGGRRSRQAQHIPLTLCLAAVVSIFAGATSARADDVHLLVISIDGLRGEWSSHPERNGLKLPNLKKLAARGTCADSLRGVFPSVTYPSHTTLITGCRPAQHGILANVVFTPPSEKSSEAWYWNYKDIRVPTLLDSAREAQLSTACVGWPVTVGAPVDVLFPEVWEPGKFDEGPAVMCMGSKPADLIPHMLTKYDWSGGTDHDVNRMNIAKYVVERYHPRVLLVHLIELDHQEHSFGPDSKEAQEAAERMDEYAGLIIESYEKAGLLDHTVVAVVSDHGFLPISQNFCINVLLREKGLIRFGEPVTEGAKTPSGPAKEWDAAGWVAGGSCAIMLHAADDKATLAKVREALAPYMGKPDSPIRRLLERDEIERLGGNTQAVLMLDAGEGFTFSPTLTGKQVVSPSPKTKGMHGQMPDRPGLGATFIIAGPGIAPGHTLSEMRMIDVAPTLAATVGLKMPKAEGQVVSEVFTTSKSPQTK